MKKLLVHGSWFMVHGLLFVVLLITYHLSLTTPIGALLITPVYAQVDWGDCVENGIATLRCFPVAIKNLADFLFLGVGIVAVFFITIAGFRFITSGGDPTQVEKARKTFTYALIGLAIVILSYLILKAVTFITGAECINTLIYNNCLQQ